MSTLANMATMLDEYSAENARLRARVEALEGALEKIAHGPLVGAEATYRQCYDEMERIARAALTEGDDAT